MCGCLARASINNLCAGTCAVLVLLTCALLSSRAPSGEIGSIVKQPDRQTVCPSLSKLPSAWRGGALLLIAAARKKSDIALVPVLFSVLRSRRRIDFCCTVHFIGRPIKEQRQSLIQSLWTRNPSWLARCGAYSFALGRYSKHGESLVRSCIDC